MKKILALLLALILAFSMSACGGKKETVNEDEGNESSSLPESSVVESSETESESATESQSETSSLESSETESVPEEVKEMRTLESGLFTNKDGDPKMVFQCGYHEVTNEYEEKLKKYNMEAVFAPDDENYPLVVIYRWENTDKLSALEAAKQNMADQGLANKEINIGSFNSWENEGDYDYAYFTVLFKNSIWGTKPRYSQQFFFAVDDSILSYEYLSPTQQVDIPGTDLAIILPTQMESENYEESEEDSDGMVVYSDPNYQFAGIEIVAEDSGDDVDFESMDEVFQESGLDVRNSKIVNMSNYNSDLQDISCLTFEIFDDSGDVPYHDYMYIINTGDKIVLADFYSDMSCLDDLQSYSAPSMIYGIVKK